MNWARLREWRHAVWLPVLAVASIVLNTSTNRVYLYPAAAALAALVVAYLAETVAWNLTGRRCFACGKPVPVRSFRLKDSCPSCGQPLS